MRDLLQSNLDRCQDQRGADRHFLRLAAAIDVRRGSVVSVHNLSRSGLLLASDAELAKGAEIVVEFAGGARHDAEVVWADDGLFGCRFTQPLSRAALSAALLRAPPPDRPGLAEGSEQGSGATPEFASDALTARAKALIILAAALACWLCFASAAYLLFS